MTTPAAHRFWMRLDSLVLIFFGLIAALGTMPATSGAQRWIMDLLSFPLDGWPAWESPETWFLSALTGGFLVGWGTLLFAAGRWLHPLAPEPVRRSVMSGFLAWFVVDSAGSIASGNWENALWNVLVLVFLMGPLWRPAHPQS